MTGKQFKLLQNINICSSHFLFLILLLVSGSQCSLFIRSMSNSVINRELESFNSSLLHRRKPKLLRYFCLLFFHIIGFTLNQNSFIFALLRCVKLFYYRFLPKRCSASLDIMDEHPCYHSLPTSSFFMAAH